MRLKSRPPNLLSQPARPPGQYLMAPAGMIPMVGPTPAADVALASFGQRFVATIVDNVVVLVLAFGVIPLFVSDFQNRFWGRLWSLSEDRVAAGGGAIELGPDLVHLGTLVTYASIGISLLYGVVALSLWSRTLGQRIAGIAVCPADKGKDRIGWREAIPRTLLWTVLAQGGNFLVLIQMVSVSLVLWHPRRQTLPDLIARTQVVRR